MREEASRIGSLALLAALLCAASAGAAERGVWPTPSCRGRQVWPLFCKLNHLKGPDGTYTNLPPSARGLENLPMVREYAGALSSDHTLGLGEFRRGYVKGPYGGVVKNPAKKKPYYCVRIPGATSSAPTTPSSSTPRTGRPGACGARRRTRRSS